MAKKDPLIDQRNKIDSIDDQLLRLLAQRAAVAKEIGKIKARKGEDIFASNREQEIVNRLMSKNDGPLPDEALEDIFSAIFTSCRFLQKRIEVVYFGPEATFTHQAAIRHFGRNARFTGVPSIKDVFTEVERKRADFGVVPIENSTEGVVNHTLDMFVDSDLKIIAEREEPISENLMNVSGNIKAIKTIYSHPQALAQCRKWLDTHLPSVTIHESASTADAAVRATLDGSCAAIASLLAARIYHLKPVALNIEDSPENATRFLVIGHTTPAPTGKDKTSVLFSVRDRVGALYEMLTPFRKANINLTKIESRPTKAKAWQYIFFVDFIGHIVEKRVQSALADLRRKCTYLKVLGSYPYGS